MLRVLVIGGDHSFSKLRTDNLVIDQVNLVTELKFEKNHGRPGLIINQDYSSFEYDGFLINGFFDKDVLSVLNSLEANKVRFNKPFNVFSNYFDKVYNQIMNEEEYEIYKNEAYSQADELLESKNFDKLDEKNDVDSLEKILFEVTSQYLNGSLTIGLFSTICSQFEAIPTFHNLSAKAKDIIYSGINLDYYSYIDVNLEEVKKINLHLKESLN